MFQSTINLVNDTTALLLEVPALVRGFERRTPGALPTLLDWIDRTERALSGHRLVAAADVAGFKARILAPALAADARTNLRRRQVAVAASLLHDLQRAVQDALQPHAAKLQQARDLARQLLQIVAQSGAVRYDPAGDLALMVDRIWSLCTGHEQLKPMAAQLRALLSSDDIRLLFVEEIEPRDFPLEMGVR
jgi:hypothetical protein